MLKYERTRSRSLALASFSHPRSTSTTVSLSSTFFYLQRAKRHTKYQGVTKNILTVLNLGQKGFWFLAWCDFTHVFMYMHVLYFSSESVRQYPEKPFFISETGAGGLFEWNDNKTDAYWTLKYQQEARYRSERGPFWGLHVRGGGVFCRKTNSSKSFGVNLKLGLFRCTNDSGGLLSKLRGFCWLILTLAVTAIWILYTDSYDT